MKYKRAKVTCVDIPMLINVVADYLQEVSLYLNKHYSVTFVHYTRNLKVTDLDENESYYHTVKTQTDADFVVTYYQGYSQAIYDYFRLVKKVDVDKFPKIWYNTLYRK